MIRVLIVEGDEAVRRFLRVCAERAGAEPRDFASAPEAEPQLP